MSSEDSRSPEGKILTREMRATYASLWGDEFFADCTVVVEDKEVKVHKLVLLTFGPVFKSMLRTGLRETSTCRIEISDYPYDVVVNMLEYMYTGVFTQKMDEIALDLMKIANKYFQTALISKCGKSLAQKLSLDNALDMMVVANTYNNEMLMVPSLKFIRQNYESIRTGEKWNQFKAENVDLVEKIADFLFSPTFSPKKKPKLG
ncbi:hypothetical protein HA402_010562 [Bradysia odoriphaga]|nr:hypothetical protein HA402_010562 [Bradysia odoriphaga]